jgi:hypothetical protein
MKVSILVGYLCPGCDGVHPEPPEQRAIPLFTCGETVPDGEYQASPGTYYKCGECDGVCVTRDEAKGCCRV